MNHLRGNICLERSEEINGGVDEEMYVKFCHLSRLNAEIKTKKKPFEKELFILTGAQF